MIPTFFGLSPNYKPILHTQIFDLIYYGKGGFNWADIYDMPIWLRNFYYKKLVEAVEARKKAEEEASKKSNSSRIAKAPPVVKKR